MLPSSLLASCGLEGFACKSVHGGDINQTFCLTRNKERYFMKLNDARRYPRMLEKEANALTFMKGKTQLCIPDVIMAGEADGMQYLVLEWLEAHNKSKNFWKNFGEGLVTLHRQTQDSFGWTEDNYVGSLHQSNLPASTWSLFYAGQRILPLVKQLCVNGHMTSQDMQLSEKLCDRLDGLFPKEPPALLHGDLWSGNFMPCTKGPAIYDPAIYYGHREMDLGMSLLFGGFADEFYDVYENAWPLEKGWRQRIPLTQLYPLLVHACLFGGHYIETARTVIRKFL